MKTAIQIFLKQTRRGTKRLALQLVLLCAVTMFFVVSMNLCSNSRQNLLTVENIYSTIATMEFYGYVTADGKLVHPGDEACVGRHLLSVEDYDFSELLALNSVNSIELRNWQNDFQPRICIPDELEPIRREVIKENIHLCYVPLCGHHN